MTTTLIDGQRTWSMTQDDEGHREYSIAHRIKADFTDGPYNVRNTAGLPLPGSIWSFDGDTDSWAFCYPNATVEPATEDEKNRWWTVKQKFSTKPLKRCNTTTIENPLLEPQKVSGSFVRYTKEAIRDRLGMPIRSSSHEQIRGPQVEFDDDRPSVRIEQNVASLNLPVLTQMRNTLNDAPLWGLSERMIKFRPASWERKLFGTCNFYYTRVLEFDINFDTFDRLIVDAGTQVLRGHWGAGTGAGCTIDITSVNADGEITGVSATPATGGSGYQEGDPTAIIQLKVTGGSGTGGVVLATVNNTGVVIAINQINYHGTGYTTGTGLATESGSGWILDEIDGAIPNINNPQHFMRYKDINGENGRVLLNGGGCPLPDGEEPVYLPLEYYFESNLLLLGIPTSL